MIAEMMRLKDGDTQTEKKIIARRKEQLGMRTGMKRNWMKGGNQK